jgi:hypothetical protein
VPDRRIIKRALPWWIGALVISIAAASIAISRGGDSSDPQEQNRDNDEARNQELADRVAQAAEGCRAEQASPVDSVPKGITRRPIDVNEFADGSSPEIEGVDAFLLGDDGATSTVAIVPVGDDQELYSEVVLGPADALTNAGYNADQLKLGGTSVLSMAAPNEDATLFFGRLGCYGVVVRGVDGAAARAHASLIFGALKD